MDFINSFFRGDWRIGKIFRGDRVIWMIFMFLCFISIVEVYSATSMLTYRQNFWDPIVQHTKHLLVGLVFLLLCHTIPPKWFSNLRYGLYIVWIFLLWTKFFGQTINGADRYMTIGPIFSLSITFQPSELAKLGLILYTAYFLAERKTSGPEDKTFKWIMIIAGITCGLIVIDNFSTAALLFSTIFLMMFVGQIPWNKLGKIILVGITGATLFISALLYFPPEAETLATKAFHRWPSWKSRIEDFSQSKPVVTKNPSTFEINDDNYQVVHAKIAIARGGIIGKMPGNSMQRDFLPQAYSDFIYAIIIEELGLIIGGLGVLLLYVFLLIRVGIIANRCDLLFLKYLTLGCGLMIVWQALINMGVTVDLVPVTGLPLPLVSRGGTSTIVNCIYFGIILSVSRFNNPRGIEREQEIALEAEMEEQAAIEAEAARREEEANLAQIDTWGT